MRRALFHSRSEHRIARGERAARRARFPVRSGRVKTLPPPASWPFPPGESPYHMKGLVYRTTVTYLNRTAGRFEAVLKEVGPEIATFLRQPFLAASWYDLGPVIALNDAAARVVDMPTEDFIRERTHAQALQDLTGVYSFVLKLASPLAVAQALPRLTSRYFDWGGVEIRKHSATYVEPIRTGVPRYIARWYFLAAEGFMLYAIEKAGGRAVRIEMAEKVRGVENGISMCDLHFHVRWE
jgi:hypothetical protein